MIEHSYDSIVIGGGQAGLAAGYHLRRAGVRFRILDRGSEIGQAWRRRWTSLRLFTPARFNALPGLPFPGDPDALPAKDDVASYLRGYAEHFELPVELGVSVQSLEHDGDGFVVTTGGGPMRAASVIVATGGNQRPFVPSFAASLSSEILQMHSSGYSDPTSIRPGDVLVVGAGNSGAQIALELRQSGRRVLLSGPETGSFPRRILGRDLYDWLWPTVMRPTRDSWIGHRVLEGRFAAADPLIGIREGDLRQAGIERVGRTTGTRHGYPVLDDGTVLGDVAAIVWCTGFRPDFDWIRLPLFDADGYPRHRRGLVDAPRGLGFLGLRYQSRMGSALLGGVGEDAEYVVQALMRDLTARAA